MLFSFTGDKTGLLAQFLWNTEPHPTASKALHHLLLLLLCLSKVASEPASSPQTRLISQEKILGQEWSK